MRGRMMSSAKRVWPVTLARPSTRRRGLPMTRVRRVIVAPPRPSRGRSLGGRFDRFDDLQVAGAAAQVARQRLADPLARRMRLAIEQRLRGDQDARRAVAALRGAEVGEALLQRMQPAVRGEPFDGRDRAGRRTRPPAPGTTAPARRRRSTAQAPHSPSSQPCLVPVSCRSSRSTSSSVL